MPPPARGPYLALLPVGLALPPLLPAARWALTPPFHPYHTLTRALRHPRHGGLFLWRSPSGHPARALPGTVALGSPDFPRKRPEPPARSSSLLRSVRLFLSDHKVKAQAREGALPLLAFCQFTPGYFWPNERGSNLHLAINIPEREAEPRLKPDIGLSQGREILGDQGTCCPGAISQAQSRQKRLVISSGCIAQIARIASE